MGVTYIPRAFGGTIIINTSPPATPASYTIYRFPQTGCIPGVPGTFATGQEVGVDLTQVAPTVFETLPSIEAGPYAPNSDGTGNYHHGSS